MLNMRVGCVQIEEILYEIIFIVVTSPTMYVNGPDWFNVQNQGGKHLNRGSELEKEMRHEWRRVSHTSKT